MSRLRVFESPRLAPYPIDPVRISLLWPRPLQPPSVLLHLALDVAVEMKYVYILTWAKGSPGTGPWTSAATTFPVNDLFGSQTATLSSSFYHKTVQTTPSFACKCVWWDGMMTLSTGMITTSQMQTIGCALALIYASTPYSKVTSTSRVNFVLKIPPQPHSQWNLRTCPITVAHE